MTPKDNVKKKVLVADDNRELCENLKDILDSLGHQTFLAFDGQEAIEQFKDVHPDVVLLDIEMPEKDGFAVLKEIKRLAPEMRVLVLTANHNPYVADEIRRRGAAAVFTKPFDFKKVHRMIHEYGEC